MRFLFRSLFLFIAPCRPVTSTDGAGASTAVVHFRSGNAHRVVDAAPAANSASRPDGPQSVAIAACASANPPHAAMP